MELLAPAGSPEALTAAVQAGADAVYLGFGPLNARRNAKNFTREELEAGVAYCHLRGVKVYLTLNTLLTARGTAPVADGARLIDLLRRPQVSYDDLRPFDPAAPELPVAVREQVEISVKYEGYIRRQQRQVEDFEQLEKHALPDRMDYSAIQGLRLEAREKLDAVRPLNLGQASRISGVSPADVGALMIWLQTHRDKEE